MNAEPQSTPLLIPSTTDLEVWALPDTASVPETPRIAPPPAGPADPPGSPEDATCPKGGACRVVGRAECQHCSVICDNACPSVPPANVAPAVEPASRASSTALPLEAASLSPLDTPAPFGLVDELLRDRGRFLHRIAETDELTVIARTMLLTILVCAAGFGATLGLSHGGWQILFAAMKLPLAVLFTACLASPALSALRSAMDGQTDVRGDFALVLGSLALGSTVLAGLAPLFVLAWLVGLGYHVTILLTFVACSVAGAATLQLFRRGLAQAGRVSRLVLVTTMLVFALVGAQMSWTLRPFLAHPSGQVTFLRPLEGSLFESVSTSWDSARGIYRTEVSR